MSTTAGATEDTTGTDDASEAEGHRSGARLLSGPGFRLSWRIFQRDRAAWLISLVAWTLFHSMPVATGYALGRVLDAISDGDPASGPWAALALLAGFEVSRWTIFLWAVVQWHGAWVGWHTYPRMSMLDSLVSDAGPAEGRLPSSPGEAVSRFRDDAEDVALVLDVWLDVIGTGIAAVLAFAILLSIDVRTAVTVALPAAAVMALANAMGPVLRRWRHAAREATAAVTGFVGDTFGAIGSVKAAGGEAAVVTRFTALGHDRAHRAVRDEVGTQLLYTLSGATADIALAAALVVAAPAVAEGTISVGDLGMIAAYATVLAGLPRFVGLVGAHHRQADVSAQRMARLLPDSDRSPARVAGHAELRLRAARGDAADASVGPVPGREDPDVSGPRPGDLISRHPSRASLPRSGLEVAGLTVRRSGRPILDDVDLTVAPGAVVAVTGPVGSGKSSLLRAVLGLIPSEGSIRWDGQDTRATGRLLVPPRVAYVPQTPRLFSEPLADAILLGLPVERIEHAIHLACMEQDLDSMPEGLDTVVGSSGVRLSGGQIQRVAAARALARHPSLLVVDDLSSALDAATEADLWERILAVTGTDGTSVLVVTHRPSVLDRADEVVALVEGRRAG